MAEKRVNRKDDLFGYIMMCQSMVGRLWVRIDSCYKDNYSKLSYGDLLFFHKIVYSYVTGHGKQYDDIHQCLSTVMSDDDRELLTGTVWGPLLVMLRYSAYIGGTQHVDFKQAAHDAVVSRR